MELDTIRCILRGDGRFFAVAFALLRCVLPFSSPWSRGLSEKLSCVAVRADSTGVTVWVYVCVDFQTVCVRVFEQFINTYYSYL